VVYALELPAEFPQGSQLDEPASIKGFFYRRWWYMAGDAKKPETHRGRLAPMLLARGIEWTPRPPPINLRARYTGIELFCWVAGGAIVALAIGVVLMRRYTRDDALPEYIRIRMKREEVGEISGDMGRPDIQADLEELRRAEAELQGDDSSPPAENETAENESDGPRPPQAPA
jgi:hypothetical protein